MRYGRYLPLALFLAVLLSSPVLADRALAQAEQIPSWVKTLFTYYAQGQISDAELLAAIEYLIEQGVISVPDQEYEDRSDFYATYETAVSDPSDDLDPDEVTQVDYSKQDRTLHYTVTGIPFYASQNDVQEAIRAAVSTWSDDNPGLEFVEVPHDEFYHVKITWQKYPIEFNQTESGTALGIATSMYNAPDEILISIGSDDCDDTYLKSDQDSLANTIAHEWGHILGLGHHEDEDHLMYSEGAFDAQKNFVDQGLNIPKVRDGGYGNWAELERRLVGLNGTWAEWDSTWTEYDKENAALQQQLDQYPDQMSNSAYEEYSKIYDRQTAIIDMTNELVDEMNELVDEMDEIADRQNCIYFES